MQNVRAPLQKYPVLLVWWEGISKYKIPNHSQWRIANFPEVKF